MHKELCMEEDVITVDLGINMRLCACQLRPRNVQLYYIIKKLILKQNLHNIRSLCKITKELISQEVENVRRFEL